MKKESCIYFEARGRREACSAPMCPLENNLNPNWDNPHAHAIWYPDEEICRRQPVPRWVKRQKKIAKKCKLENMVFYFNLIMLKQNPTIAMGIKGLDPDSIRNEEKLMKGWIKKHPPISEARKEQGRNIRKLVNAKKG